MVFLNKPMRIATLNVRGLADRRRQNQLYRLVTDGDLDIVALQETKVESEDQTDRMVRPFMARYDVCVSHAVGLSAGCVLLIRRSLGATLKAVTASEAGRFVVCDFDLGLKEWRVICVYGPNNGAERKAFFEDLRTWCNTERLLILLGDFNCVCSARDKSSLSNFRDASTAVLNDIVTDFALEDVGDSLGGAGTVQYTHFQGNSHARLDRLYMSLELLPECDDYQVSPVSFSDHCLVSVSLGRIGKRRNAFCWGLWKFNNKLLEDEEFVEAVVVCGREYFCSNDNVNYASKWEHFKQRVKMKALERSSAMKYEEKRKEAWLRSSLDVFVKEECKSPGMFKDDILTLKAQLEVIDRERYHGAIVRARAERFLLGEAPTKRALSSEKRYARRNVIAEIVSDGVVYNDQSNIERCFCEHYEKLFARHPVDVVKFKEEFICLMPKLAEETIESLARDITVEEVRRAIDELNTGKTPGPDGLSAAFYKKFKEDLSPVLCRVYLESYQNGRLPPSFLESHTIFIPKSEDDAKLREISGYRPISLTNVDYKILMKILASRMQTVIKDIVGPHQTCGIKGRSIVTNVHTARSVLECCDSVQGTLAMLQIDLAKAFDQVSHELLLNMLEQVNVGSVILDGVRMAYTGCTTKLVVNKTIGKPIPVQRSVRQGCPLSPLLFCVYIEAFCLSIIKSQRFNGFLLESCEVRVLAYADDIALFCVDRSSISVGVNTLKTFCKYSGSGVNWQKCLGFWHGYWDTTPSVFECISWQTTPAKYLGVPLENYVDSDPYWHRQAAELREKAEKWKGSGLSMFARASVCNVFFMSKLWYVLQVLHCSRKNVQALHRVFAVFIWGSTWEQTSRTNLFRRVRVGGLSLSHLFLRQVVNRFLFLRDVNDPFLRTVCQMRLARALPDFVVSSAFFTFGAPRGYFREVVLATKFLRARFTLEYLSNVTRKRLYHDLADIVLPEPMYRSMYRAGPGQDVLKRVKRMAVPPWVKTFFFKLHVGVLPVKTWQKEKGLYIPWGVDCYPCKKPETVEHVFLECWDGVFFWDVLQRTLKKDFPLDAYGIRFLPIQSEDGVPYDLVMVLALHGIWKSRMAIRHRDIDAKRSKEYFSESVRLIIEVWRAQPEPPEWLPVFETLTNMKQF